MSWTARRSQLRASPSTSTSRACRTADFYYLIGLVAVEDGPLHELLLLGRRPTQEKAIWDACSQIINRFQDYTLYHYGRYESDFLDRMARLADEEGAAAIDRIRARSCNVLAAIYSHIYFPTRSNGLKDVATFLGATWTAANASGIQSLAWRLAWETSGDETLKQQLLVYNLEDCLALRRVTEFVLSVCAGANGANGGVGRLSPLPRTSSRREAFRFRQDRVLLPGTGADQQVRLLRLPAREGIPAHQPGDSEEPAAEATSRQENTQGQ